MLSLYLEIVILMDEINLRKNLLWEEHKVAVL